jgi:hypothetical protein
LKVIDAIRSAAKVLTMHSKPAGISVIIPTLWAPGGSYVLKLIRKLSRHNQIGEIILIDNNPSAAPAIPEDLPKLRYLPQRQNLYVNPSWNLGVAKAQHPLIALCNDDILPPAKLFKLACRTLGRNSKQPIGLIGVDKTCFEKKSKKAKPRICNVKERRYAYGCLMLMRKASFQPIPEWLKIYSGDTWLFREQIKQGRYNLAIEGLFIGQRSGQHSLSSSQPEFSPLKRADDANFAILREHGMHESPPLFNAEVLETLRQIQAELRGLRLLQEQLLSIQQVPPAA